MSIYESVKGWFDNMNQRRQNERVRAPLVVAYPNGGPKVHLVQNISPDGAYVESRERWYPGTIVTMVFQYDPAYLRVVEIRGHPQATVTMRARVLRNDADGAGVQFVYIAPEERARFEQFLQGAQVKEKK